MTDERPAAATPPTSRRAMRSLEKNRPRRPSEIYKSKQPAVEDARTPRWADTALVVIFLIAIALPAAAMVLRLDSQFASEENRALAPRPALPFDRAALAEFPGRFEAFVNDQFGYRRRLIHWLNIIKVAALGVSPSPKVVLGKNDWLFYGDFALDYYRAIQPLGPRQLENWRRGLERRRDWLAARGIPYFVVVAPDKNTIYPEYMPTAYNRVRALSRLDQLIAHLSAHSSLTIIDLREPLLAAKARAQVYYRTDSHWNNRGAYAGYTKIMEALSARFPQLQAIPRSDFRETRFSEPGRDLAMILAMREYYRDDYVDLVMMRPKLARQVREPTQAVGPAKRLPTTGPDIIFTQAASSLPRAVMFRDSFADALIPLLSEHFQRIVFSWQYTFDRELVECERPDVVIQEMAARTLMDPSLFNRGP